MSSTFIRASFAALALTGVVAACDSTSNDSAQRAAPSPSADTQAPTSGAYSSSDAAASTAPQTIQASPLCGFTEGSTCFPDDDEAAYLAASADSNACPAKASDDDAGDDAGPAHQACRVRAVDAPEKGAAPAYAPNCEDADGAGTDGVSCSRSTDCAPGFDCVIGEKGNTCRRYCCSGSCEQQPSQNAGPTFCDVQTLALSDRHKAPVCIPLKSCKLFAQGDCGSNETCAVVTDSGRTGCVSHGSAKVNSPCDEEHCEAGLNCLGSPGMRRCYKLCRLDGSDCASDQTCMPSSVFQDKAFGVCQAN